MVNLVLPFTILFATFIASLPTTDVTSHLSDIDTLDDRAPSDKPIIITPSIETDVSVKRTETSTPAIPQQPATTLATVISSSSATPAKGSGNSRQYAYYILKCIIGMQSQSSEFDTNLTGYRSHCRQVLQNIWHPVQLFDW